MKKIVFFLTILFCSVSLFAEPSKFSTFVELGGSYQFYLEEASIETESSSEKLFTSMNSFSIDFSVKDFFKPDAKVGLGGNINLFFPLGISMFTNTQSANLSNSDFDLLVGATFLMGPAIRPVVREKFMLTVTPGVALDFIVMKAENVNETVMLGGLGAEVGADFFISEKSYIKLGLDYRYYFIGKAENGLGKANSFAIQPSIAFGFITK